MLVLWVQFSLSLCNYISFHMRTNAQGTTPALGNGALSPPAGQPHRAPAPSTAQAGHCLGANGWSVGPGRSLTAKQLTAKLTTGTTAVPSAVPPRSAGHCCAPHAAASLPWSPAGCDAHRPAPRTCLRL